MAYSFTPPVQNFIAASSPTFSRAAPIIITLPNSLGRCHYSSSVRISPCTSLAHSELQERVDRSVSKPGLSNNGPKKHLTCCSAVSNHSYRDKQSFVSSFGFSNTCVALETEKDALETSSTYFSRSASAKNKYPGLLSKAFLDRDGLQERNHDEKTGSSLSHEAGSFEEDILFQAPGLLEDEANKQVDAAPNFFPEVDRRPLEKLQAEFSVFREEVVVTAYLVSARICQHLREHEREGRAAAASTAPTDETSFFSRSAGAPFDASSAQNDKAPSFHPEKLSHFAADAQTMFLIDEHAPQTAAGDATATEAVPSSGSGVATAALQDRLGTSLFPTDKSIDAEDSSTGHWARDLVEKDAPESSSLPWIQEDLELARTLASLGLDANTVASGVIYGLLDAPLSLPARAAALGSGSYPPSLNFAASYSSSPLSSGQGFGSDPRSISGSGSNALQSQLEEFLPPDVLQLVKSVKVIGEMSRIYQTERQAAAKMALLAKSKASRFAVQVQLTEDEVRRFVKDAPASKASLRNSSNLGVAGDSRVNLSGSATIQTGDLGGFSKIKDAAIIRKAFEEEGFGLADSQQQATGLLTETAPLRFGSTVNGVLQASTSADPAGSAAASSGFTLRNRVSSAPLTAALTGKGSIASAAARASLPVRIARPTLAVTRTRGPASSAQGGGAVEGFGNASSSATATLSASHSAHSRSVGSAFASAVNGQSVPAVALAGVPGEHAGLSSSPSSSKGAFNQEKFRRVLIAMEDVKAVLVKLAERVATLRRLRDSSSNVDPNGNADGDLSDHRRLVAQEALEVYAAVANRLGVWCLKAELEDLAFSMLHPREYARMQREVGGRQDPAALGLTIDRIKAALVARGIQVEDITGRAKNLYGIWKKLDARGGQRGGLDGVFDVTALRVVVPSKSACYEALAAVRELYPAVPGRFKDFITEIRKPNGYQSLHLAIWGEDGAPVEVQIRTSRMHCIAEYGFAAHWKYKEQLGSEEDWLEKETQYKRWLTNFKLCLQDNRKIRPSSSTMKRRADVSMPQQGEQPAASSTVRSLRQSHSLPDALLRRGASGGARAQASPGAAAAVLATAANGAAKAQVSVAESIAQTSTVAAGGTYSVFSSATADESTHQQQQRAVYGFPLPSAMGAPEGAAARGTSAEAVPGVEALAEEATVVGEAFHVQAPESSVVRVLVHTQDSGDTEVLEVAKGTSAVDLARHLVDAMDAAVAAAEAAEDCEGEAMAAAVARDVGDGHHAAAGGEERARPAPSALHSRISDELSSPSPATFSFTPSSSPANTTGEDAVAQHAGADGSLTLRTETRGGTRSSSEAAKEKARTLAKSLVIVERNLDPDFDSPVAGLLSGRDGSPSPFFPELGGSDASETGSAASWATGPGSRSSSRFGSIDHLISSPSWRRGATRAVGWGDEDVGGGVDAVGVGVGVILAASAEKLGVPQAVAQRFSEIDSERDRLISRHTSSRLFALEGEHGMAGNDSSSSFSAVREVGADASVNGGLPSYSSGYARPSSPMRRYVAVLNGEPPRSGTTLKCGDLMQIMAVSPNGASDGAALPESLSQTAPSGGGAKPRRHSGTLAFAAPPSPYYPSMSSRPSLLYDKMYDTMYDTIFPDTGLLGSTAGSRSSAMFGGFNKFGLRIQPDFSFAAAAAAISSRLSGDSGQASPVSAADGGGVPASLPPSGLRGRLAALLSGSQSAAATLSSTLPAELSDISYSSLQQQGEGPTAAEAALYAEAACVGAKEPTPAEA